MPRRVWYNAAMTTLTITDSFVETQLQQISSAENKDMDRVTTRLLKRAILAARPRPVYDLEAIKANAAEFAAGAPNAGAAPQAVGAAYTNSAAGATSTSLYVIDAGRGVLALQGGPNGAPSPNGGVLTTVGPLGVNTASPVGFDMSPRPAPPSRPSPRAGGRGPNSTRSTSARVRPRPSA